MGGGERWVRDLAFVIYSDLRRSGLIKGNLAIIRPEKEPLPLSLGRAGECQRGRSFLPIGIDPCTYVSVPRQSKFCDF